MSKLLINEYPLQVLPKLAVAIGLNEAIVLQQIHYWLERSGTEKKGFRWVYNTVQQWQDQFPFWSLDTVRRTLARLKSERLIVGECLSENSFDKTMYYRIDYDVLAAVDDGKLQSSEIAKPRLLLDRTETTTETTQKGASRRRAPRADLSFADWIENCKTADERAIPENDPVFEYAHKAGLPLEYIVLHWKEFKERYATDGKRYKDWRAVYRKSVRGNWFRLWFFTADGICTLTTQGQQANRIHKEQA
jgi:hypothetical protein